MNLFSTLKSKTIRVRFFSTIIANIIRFVLGFFSGIFIARALGPVDFGNFNFLLTSFTAISQLLNMGTATAFYTFISRRKRARNFYIYYIMWVGVQFVVSLLLATVLLPETMRGKIWLGHERGIIVLSLLASFSMSQLWQVVNQAGESIRETVTVQAYNVVLSVVYILVVLIIIHLGIMSISNLFVFIAGEYVIFTVLLSRRLKDKLISEGEVENLRNIFQDFKSYCYPLITSSLAGFLYTFADNWLLQRFGGAVEQGFYSVGYRFTFFSTIATASMLQVFWKEIAEAMERHDLEHVRDLTLKVSRLLYFFSAVLSCFLIPFSKELLIWLLGPSYESAWLCLSIMLLFPLIQAVGHPAHAVLLAGGRTKVYRNFGVINMLLSLPVTYFLLASPRAYFGIGGLGLGSVGLAMKTVILNFILTNVLIYVTSRLHRWRFDFWYQIVGVLLLLPVAFLSKLATGWLLGAVIGVVSIPTLLISSMVLYLIWITAVVYFVPGITGLERDELKEMLEKVRTVLFSNTS